MGLGGHLTWTAAIREIYEHKSMKSFPCGRNGKAIKSEIFLNNPYCTDRSSEKAFFLPLD